VVVAAGNSGRDNSAGANGYGTIQAPGNDPSVITVGATKTNDTPTRLDDNIASYSSKGPSLVDHIAKPDLVAPGNRIASLESPGSHLATAHTLEVIPMSGPGGKYLRLSGTSMATPVVAGAAALMIQQDSTLTPDTIKARMMKTAWKGYPTTSWAVDMEGFSHLSQYDIFTIGAGYLDVDAVLHNTDVASGSAASPTATFDSCNHRVKLTNSSPLVSGTSIIWDNSAIFANSIVWGGDAVLADSIVWGSDAAWGDTSIAANSIIWADSIVWGSDSLTDGLDAMSCGEDGEN
jgi:serine protease AprX